MNIVGFFSVTADRNMFHEASSRQKPLLPQARLRCDSLATAVR